MLVSWTEQVHVFLGILKVNVSACRFLNHKDLTVSTDQLMTCVNDTYISCHSWNLTLISLLWISVYRCKGVVISRVILGQDILQSLSNLAFNKFKRKPPPLHAWSQCLEWQATDFQSMRSIFKSLYFTHLKIP